MTEFKKPKFYKSLNALFTRELEIPREINEDKQKVKVIVDLSIHMNL